MQAGNQFFKQPFIKNGRYYNYEGEPTRGFLYHTLRIWLNTLFHGPKKIGIDPSQWSMQQPVLPRSDKPAITWIGHSTFLIQVGGATILTDPTFGNVSPFFPRIIKPGLALNDIPPLDALLISHNHWDHMDGKTLKRFSKEQLAQCHILVPQGDEAWFAKRNFSNAEGLEWGRKKVVVTNSFDHYKKEWVKTRIVFTFLPAHHWSQRGLFDRNKSLWGSWMIECNGYTIYFGGDTAYAGHFKEIAARFPLIDIAILPIAPCEPHEWLYDTHMNAEQAGQAFLDLKARHFIPTHWGTFNLGNDQYEAPIKRIQTWWKKHEAELALQQLHILKIGERAQFDYNRTEEFIESVKGTITLQTPHIVRPTSIITERSL